jgi:hypothetical protein
VTTGLVMAANANVGRIAENNDPDQTRTGRNPSASSSATICAPSNPWTAPRRLASMPGQFDAGGQINTYFRRQFPAGQALQCDLDSISSRITKRRLPGDHLHLPDGLSARRRQSAGRRQEPGRDGQFDWSAAYNSTYSCSAQLDRLEYFEA